jgi:Tfp pilus assembly protein PilO
MRDRRGPLIAGVASVLVAVLAVFFLVLPKMHAVTEAQRTLDDARAQQSTLQTQLNILKADQQQAPTYRREIKKVQNQLPPTADLPGLILLLQHAADQSGVDLSAVTPGTPAFNGAGVSVIGTNITVNGTYFALDAFLFKLETFPRAAKVTGVTMAPVASGTSTSGQIVMQVVVEFYTTDTSAGPGGQPGPSQSPGA